jgi:hypothetical protein
MVVVSDEYENHPGFGLRVIWLIGIVCGSWVFGTDMRCELLVAPLFELRLHLLNGIAHKRPWRVEQPCAFGASPALKILAFDPYQFATHRPPRVLNSKGLKITDGEGPLSVGYPTLARIAYLNPWKLVSNSSRDSIPLAW